MAVSSNHNGWRYDSGNSRLDYYYRGTRVGHINATGLYVAGTAVTTNAMLDDVLYTFGTDSDAAFVVNTAGLSAGEELTGVVVGTSVGSATAANSLLISNITASGDIVAYANTGGNSQEYWHIDSSAGLMVFNEASADLDFRWETNGNANALVIDGGADTITVGTTLRLSATMTGFLGFGAAETATIATGVLTVTKPYVIMDAEGAGTTDQLDSITYTGVAAGDLLLLICNATDTITVDDANINLGAATRAVAPGGSLLLRYDGTEAQWTEVLFLAAADNV